MCTYFSLGLLSRERIDSEESKQEEEKLKTGPWKHHSTIISSQNRGEKKKRQCFDDLVKVIGSVK